MAKLSRIQNHISWLQVQVRPVCVCRDAVQGEDHEHGVLLLRLRLACARHRMRLRLRLPLALHILQWCETADHSI